MKRTLSKPGGDRFIPKRNCKQMDVASFLLAKANEPMDTNESTASAHNPKAWSVALNGCNIEDAKILHFGIPEGYQKNLKVLYSQGATPGSSKKRHISSVPEIWDAPGFRNDFSLNLLDWSSQNILAVALDDSVDLANVTTRSTITRLMKMETYSEEYISSLSFNKEGHHLAVGTSDCKVHLWDVASGKRLRTMDGHSDRVGSLSWNEHVVSSGSYSGRIHHDDVRMPNPIIASLEGHSQEVGGLKWSPDGRYLASGGNDNMVHVWPGVANMQPIHSFSEHTATVKALAWCPWKSNHLASGGGTIRVWNVNSGSCVRCIDTESQIMSLVFAPNYKELVSGHGYPHNNVVIWNVPTSSKVMELNGHEDRVLNLAANPDCSTIASIAGDETICLWKSFELDPIRKKAKHRPVTKSTSGVISHHTIR